MVSAVGAPAFLPVHAGVARLATASSISPVARASDTVDQIKARSTLVSLVQPLAWVSQLASHPADTAHTLGSVAQHVVGGQFGAAGSDLGGLVNGAMHPTGIPAGIYHAGLYMQAGVDALVGGVELYYGAQGHDTALKLMGVTDLVGSASSVVFALGDTSVAFGLNLASNTARAALVLMRPKDYSRIQKMKTLFDGMASVSAGLMKAGIAPVPALAGYIGFGMTQVVYMNSETFRKRMDAAIDWVLGHL